MLTVNPIDFPDWDDLLASFPDYSFFHTSTWAGVLHESYGYEPLYIVPNGQNALPAALPLMEVRSFLTGTRGVSLPFTDHCEPVATRSSHLEGLIDFAIDCGRKRRWRYLELRGGQSLLARNEPSEVYLGHTLDLDRDPDRVFFRLRHSTKRNIRKAEREGVSVEITRSPEAMAEFCRLNCLTRKEHGLPPQPWNFFRGVRQ